MESSDVSTSSLLVIKDETQPEFSPQTSVGHMNTSRAVDWHLQLHRRVTKMSQALFCDCVLSKFSQRLSVLHFKLFLAAALLDIFKLVDKIERGQRVP